MSSIVIHIDDQRFREAIARAPDVMDRSIDVKLWRGAEEVAREAKARAPKAFSNLVNSIRADRVGHLHYQVSQGMNYGRAVEEGSRPHFPKPDALVPWVEMVLKVSGDEALDKAFMIARSINKRGIKPQPFMAPSADAKRSRLFDLVQQGANEGLRGVFG